MCFQIYRHPDSEAVPSSCTHYFPCKIDLKLCVPCVCGGTANICICFVIWILALLCAYFDVLFSSFLNFKRDLYKCLAAGSLKAGERHAKGQTDQTGQSAICSKPYISLVLVSYWMVRPFSLHAALQTRPGRRLSGTGLICANQRGGRQRRCGSLRPSVSVSVIIDMMSNSSASELSQIFLICDNICKCGCESCQLIPFLWPCINNHVATPVHSLETLWRNSSVYVNVAVEAEHDELVCTAALAVQTVM